MPSETSSVASPTSSRSSKKTCHFSPDVPVLTVIPPSLSHLPTPPLTPLTPLTPCLKRRTSYFHSDRELVPSPPRAPLAPVSPLLADVVATPPSAPSAPEVTLIAPAGIPIPTPDDADHHLHAPLCAHLTLLHPSTPREVIHFCATRLLSPERPYALGQQGKGCAEGDVSGGNNEGAAAGEENTEEGNDKEWTPIWAGLGDLATAGLGLEAAKGCEQVGPGKEIDEQLEWMYGVARESWGMLEMRAPSQGNRL